MISFPKDILIIDFETSLGDNEKSEPVQFAAILLDKVSFEEKKSFVSFIKTDLSLISPKRLVEKSYTPEKINNAPLASEVGKKFLELFGKDFFISSWCAGLDIIMFRKLMSSAGIGFSEFDYHVYDLWPIAYTNLLEKGYNGSWRSEAMFQQLGLPSRGIHDALEDCRHAAQVFRKIIARK